MQNGSWRGRRGAILAAAAAAALVLAPLSLLFFLVGRRAWVGALLSALLASAAVGVAWGVAQARLLRTLAVRVRDVLLTEDAPARPVDVDALAAGVQASISSLQERNDYLRRRFQDAEALAMTSHALDGARFPDEMLGVVLDRAAKLVDYGRGYASLVDDLTGEWRIVASRGYAPDEIRAVRAELLAGNPCYGALCLPLHATSGTVGALNLDVESPDASTLDLLRVLADIAATAVEKHRLYLSAQREVRAQTLLNEAGRVLTSTLDKQEVLTRIMHEVTHALNAAAGSVLLVDEDQGDMYFAAAASPAADLLLGTRMALDQGIVGWTIQRSESVLVDDAHSDPRFYGQIDAQTGLDTRSVVCVPLMSKDRVIGAIEVIDPRSGNFTEADLRLLESLAPQAAIAIDNASLHESIKEQMDELERTQDQLLQAEKLSAIGQLVAGVAHELNNPLTAIVGYSQLLLEVCEDPQFCEDLGRIEREAQRSARIVQNLLSFARQSKMEKRPIQLGQVVDKTIDLLAYQLEVDNIEVVREISPEPMVVLADRYQLQQVFLNLISNAHQSMRKTRGSGTLIIRAYPTAEGMVRAQFADNGTGIPKEIQGRIFDPFFTTKDVGEGTGLGLSICMGIVQEHQGQIWPESAEGQGATFIVELPAYDGDAEDVPALSPAIQRPATGSHSILVVDDEAQITALLRRVLESEGHTVTTVGSGLKAKEVLTEQGFDMMICDLKMPGMDGRALYAHLQQVYPELARRVIFFTGDTVSEQSWSFLQSVDNPYLSKPFQPEQVLQAIHEMWSN